MIDELVRDCAIAAASHICNLLDTGASKTDQVGSMTFVIRLAIEKAIELRGEYLNEIHYLEPSEN